MDFSFPETITVQGRAEHILTASYADLEVRVRGTSLLSSGMAFKRAQEVAVLVAELADVGIADSDIAITTARAEVGSGGFGNKSSSVVYSLSIHCDNLGKLPDVIGVITTQKNISLDGVMWGYENEDAIRIELLDTATRQASQAAERLANTLKVTLLGVHSLRSRYINPEQPEITVFSPDSGSSRARPRRVSRDELGMEMKHNNRAMLVVEVDYLISRFEMAGR